MKSTTVRGTPYRKIENTANEGISPRTPAGNRGTVDKMNSEPGIRTGPQPRGTPYQSQAGNSDEFSRVASQGKYGHVVDTATGENMNDPRSNGDGVILDDMATDYNDPRHAPTIDSPVSPEAPIFETRTIAEENAAHLGRGRGSTAPNRANATDDLLAIGGVMSRGMLGTSSSQMPETALANDDVLPSVPPAGKV
jgi:hypothetical protein